MLTGRLVLTICLGAAEARAGYDHYFTWLQKPDPNALVKCIADMRRVIDARRNLLAGADGEGPPVLESLKLEFNGIGDEAHEPFVFPGTIIHDPPIPGVPSGFNSCKTQWKPYDEVVTACLLVARDYFPPSVLEIKSDGSWQGGTDGDWSAGANLYQAVFGRRANNPLDGGGFSMFSIGVDKILGAAAVVGILFFALRRRRFAG